MVNKEFISTDSEAHKEALSLNRAFGNYNKAVESIYSKSEMIVDYLLYTHYNMITFPPVSIYLFSDDDERENFRNICKIEMISRVKVIFDDEGKSYEYDSLDEYDLTKMLPNILSEYNLIED